MKNAKLHILRKTFETLQMKEREPVDEFMTQVMEVVNQLRAHGEGVIDQKVVENMLRSLPPSYDMLVTAIEESKNLSQL